MTGNKEKVFLMETDFKSEHDKLLWERQANKILSRENKRLAEENKKLMENSYEFKSKIATKKIVDLLTNLVLEDNYINESDLKTKIRTILKLMDYKVNIHEFGRLRKKTEVDRMINKIDSLSFKLRLYQTEIKRLVSSQQELNEIRDRINQFENKKLKEIS